MEKSSESKQKVKDAKIINGKEVIIVLSTQFLNAFITGAATTVGCIVVNSLLSTGRKNHSADVLPFNKVSGN